MGHRWEVRPEEYGQGSPNEQAVFEQPKLSLSVQTCYLVSDKELPEKGAGTISNQAQLPGVGSVGRGSER